MANFTLTPNMSLPIPTIGQDPGPDYATNQNNSFTILDGHNHSPGSGVQITPSGLNINSNLTFNSNSATNLLSANFTSQGSALTGNNFLSFVGGNLYVNDGSGNQIPITASGGVAGSPGSIGGLASPAAATYTAGSKLFSWTVSSGHYAAMANGAISIYQTNVASSFATTIAANSGIAANYQLTLPASLPGSTQYMTSDASGNLSFSTPNQIAAAMTSTGANAIASAMTSIGADAIASAMDGAGASTIATTMGTSGANTIASNRTRTTGSPTVPVGGVAVSNSCGTFTTNSNSFVNITNLSVQISTSGRPVVIQTAPDNSTNSATFINSQNSLIRLLVNGSELSRIQIGANTLVMPCYNFFHTPAAGTYIYDLQIQSSSGLSLDFFNTILIAYEL